MGGCDGSFTCLLTCAWLLGTYHRLCHDHIIYIIQCHYIQMNGLLELVLESHVRPVLIYVFEEVSVIATLCWRDLWYEAYLISVAHQLTHVIAGSHLFFFFQSEVLGREGQGRVNSPGPGAVDNGYYIAKIASKCSNTNSYQAEYISCMHIYMDCSFNIPIYSYILFSTYYTNFNHLSAQNLIRHVRVLY